MNPQLDGDRVNIQRIIITKVPKIDNYQSTTITGEGISQIKCIKEDSIDILKRRYILDK